MRFLWNCQCQIVLLKMNIEYWMSLQNDSLVYFFFLYMFRDRCFDRSKIMIHLPRNTFCDLCKFQYQPQYILLSLLKLLQHKNNILWALWTLNALCSVLGIHSKYFGAASEERRNTTLMIFWPDWLWRKSDNLIFGIPKPLFTSLQTTLMVGGWILVWKRLVFLILEIEQRQLWR